MNEKQQQLLFDKGITNVPSDALCSDNALAESVGMVYDDGEHRVIQKPETFMTGVGSEDNPPVPYTILYIHKFNDEERYIVLDGTYIKWGTNNDGAYAPAQEEYEDPQTHETETRDIVLLDVSGTPHITSVGKTLIITDGNGMHYFLWKDDGYKNIGALPEPKVKFQIHRDSSCWAAHGAEPVGFDRSGLIDNGKKQEDYNNFVVGLYSKNLKTIAQNKGFASPFFVRAAVKMYDDTYTLISQPFLMMPCIRQNTYGAYGNVKSGIHTMYGKLRYKQEQNYGDWSDIVKDVTLFITRGVSPYDTTLDFYPDYEPAGTVYADGIWSGTPSLHDEMEFQELTLPNDSLSSYRFFPFAETDNPTRHHKTDADIINELKGQSIFYKLCDIGINAEYSFTDVGKFIDSHTLENITTQEQLEYDDYYSRSSLSPEYIYSYNSRLNISNVKRSIFQGFSDFMPFEKYNDWKNYKFYVRIKTDSGDRFATVTEEYTKTIHGYYFFYPDSRANHVWIYKGTGSPVQYSLLVSADLKEHIGLNAAVYMEQLPSSNADPTTHNDNVPLPEERPSTKELIPNYVIQSEVNNPFVFKAEGYFKVGTGKILAMSSITQALSEGQFGQFPLLVFSESGVWALTVASTGYYSSIHPISREVSLDPACIIQTDGAVFFTSKKGLMVVVGSQVKCVSEQLSGKTNVFTIGGTPLVTDLGNFCDYLVNAFIAYDYRDSLLWIFNPNYTTCYIYAIKSGSFAKFTPSARITNVVNYYPDYLLQSGTTIYSLTGRTDINYDGHVQTVTINEQDQTYFVHNTYNTCMLTRPMKLENALKLKSIMQVRHIKQFTPYEVTTVQEGQLVTTTQEGSIALRIFASNNFNDWIELKSLRGMPWKYYRFRFDFSDLIATDRFAGTMLVTQERRTNKLR